MVINALRAAWLRFRILQLTARREAVQEHIRYYRDCARDARKTHTGVQTRIDNAERELHSINRRNTVARIARATV